MGVRSILLVMIAALSAAAQARTTPQAAIMPFGIWSLCDAMPGYFLCSAYTPTPQKTYLLTIQAFSRAVTNFRYTISGTINGEPWTVSGTVDRADTVWTPVQIDAPGRIDMNPAPEITITERTDVLSRRSH